jgi:hypothetical protein
MKCMFGTHCWRTFAAGLVLGTALVAPAQAQQTVAMADLGSFSAEFAAATAVSERPGETLVVTVDALPGDRLQLHLPFEPNRLQPLVANGSRVQAGDPVARVSGPALGQWLLEFELLQARYAEAQRRYLRNQSLYDQGALSADTWFAISETYRDLRLEVHHAEHVMEVLEVEGQREPAQALLHAPISGLLLFAENEGGVADHPLIAELIAAESLRLGAWIRAGGSDRALRLTSGDCGLAVIQEAQQISGFRRRVWSEPLGDCMAPRPGLLGEGRVYYAFDGFRVPRSALLRHAGQTLLAVRRGAQLALVPTQIHGEDESNYYVTANAALDGVQVLVRSNSALQGLLMGLGGSE